MRSRNWEADETPGHEPMKHQVDEHTERRCERYEHESSRTGLPSHLPRLEGIHRKLSLASSAGLLTGTRSSEEMGRLHPERKEPLDVES